MAPVISLFCDRLHKIVNQKGKAKCALIYDEFSSIRVPSIQTVIAVGRGHDIVPIIAIQDYSQLKKDYGREQAEVIMNIVGNIVCGQVTGDTAKQLSERFGKINQVKESVSINAMDTSVSRSTQLDYAIPASKIAGLSSGEFVGMVADDPNNKIELKTFHCQIQNDHDAISAEERAYQEIPAVRTTNQIEIVMNYQRIKEDIRNLVDIIANR